MWIIGIDEAGYGPNLGPFVMTSVACRVPDHHSEADLWHLLGSVVCRHCDADPGRLLVDDSKIVHGKRGLAGLEHGVLATLWGAEIAPRTCLDTLVAGVCPDDREELRREVWYRGMQLLPVHAAPDTLTPWTVRFEEVCNEADVGSWRVQSAVVCPPRFNVLLDEGGSKGIVLAHTLTQLLRWQMNQFPPDDGLVFFVDKHGGRNTYAAMIHQALPGAVVRTGQESLAVSTYEIHGLGREVRLTFQPHAEAEHFCVALASMTSKYLRELLMLEFNRFWAEHVADLKPTAGYPGDAARFLRAIRPALAKLGIREEMLWRRK
jgi:ribonuclease HII